MKIRIGTRGSALALWQTEFVGQNLRNHFPDLQIERIIIKTEGDRDQKSSLTRIGGQGVFTKTIEHALLQGQIDLAVHSLKDLPSTMTEGLMLAAVPQRGPLEDVLVTPQGLTLNGLPQGATVATGSIRRRSQLLHLRPDLQLTDLRGNIHTRLRKMHKQNLHGIIMARAALERLKISDVAYHVFSLQEMIPAVGQGAIGLQIRTDDVQTGRLLQSLNHHPTMQCVLAERTVLRVLDTGCQFPMGAVALPRKDRLELTAFVGSMDGRHLLKASESGPLNEAENIGRRLAEKMLQAGAETILKEFRNGAATQ